MKKLMLFLALVLVLTGCAPAAPTTEPAGAALANGGVLVLRVNPEIAIEYDQNGIVTGITARNEDAIAIIDACTGLIGVEARVAISQLVTAIGEAGYFVEEVEGGSRQITLEIEPGSSLPSDVFLDDLIADIKACVDSHSWTTPLDVQGEVEMGITDYVDTDYGPQGDGHTDYGHTDYGDTDYDHHSDYGHSDYHD